jgi:hypothetical protein
MSEQPEAKLSRGDGLFDSIPRSLSADPTVPLEEKGMCCVLMSFGMGKRYCFPSRTAIGAKAGLSTKQVSRIIFSMEKRKLIRVKRETGDSNVYDLQPIWEWAPRPNMSLVNTTEVVLESSEDGDQGHNGNPKENTLYLGTKVHTVVQEVPGTEMSPVHAPTTRKRDFHLEAMKWCERILDGECSAADVPDDIVAMTSRTAALNKCFADIVQALNDRADRLNQAA